MLNAAGANGIYVHNTYGSTTSTVADFGGSNYSSLLLKGDGSAFIGSGNGASVAINNPLTVQKTALFNTAATFQGSLTAQGASVFSNGAFTDPASGVAYDLKLGGPGNGLAVGGASIFSSTLGVAGSLNISAAGVSNTVGSLNLTSTAANVELGSTTATGTPLIDFHSSGTANDYDSRLIATAGTSGTSGAGNLSFMGNALVVQATLQVTKLATFQGSVAAQGHFYGTGSVPSISVSTGALGVSTGANDNHGTINTSAAATVTITFAQPRTNNADCTVTAANGTNVTALSATATKLTFNTSGGQYVTYMCDGL